MGWMMAACVMLATAGEIRSGCDCLWVDCGTAQIEVFTYKPPNYQDGPLVVVCHGVLRNADEYRDDARHMADRLGALVIAPRFPKSDFPYDRYQAGGLLRDGHLAPQGMWTGQILLRVIDDIRHREGRPTMPYCLFGHSAGAQFLVRMAGFVSSGAERIVVANAGAQLFASRELPYPYGFGDLPDEISGDAALQRYLKQPLTLYLATEDCQRDDYLDLTETADRQGVNRCERAQNSFAAARRLAEQNGWAFNWELLRVPGVAHDHQRMLDNELCEKAFGGSAKAVLRPGSEHSAQSSLLRAAIPLVAKPFTQN